MAKKILFLCLFICLNRTIAAQCTIVGKSSVCVNEPNLYKISGTGISSYAWDFGNSLTATQSAPTIVYKTPGNFTMTCIVTYTNGTRCTAKLNITVYALPAADFEIIDVVSTCFYKQNFKFLDKAKSMSGVALKTGYIDWGDGDFETINSPGNSLKVSHQFKDTGYYTITYQVTDMIGCNMKIAKKVIKILPDVQINYNAKIKDLQCNVSQICITNQTVTNQSGAIQYKLFLDNTIRSYNGSNECYSFSKGKRTVSILLTAATASGCKDSLSRTVELDDEMTLNFARMDSIYCYKSPYLPVFKLNSIPRATYNWEVNGKDVSPTTSGAELFLNAPLNNLGLGTHIIKCTVKQGLCEKSISATLKIVGIAPRLMVFNHAQCGFEDTVFILDSTKYAVGSKISRLWYFSDRIEYNCTSNYNKDQNAYSNCNYGTDQWHMYKYREDGIYSLIVKLYDSTYGCSFDTAITITTYKCPFIGSGNGGADSLKLIACTGTKFYSGSVKYTLFPKTFQFNSGPKRPWLDILTLNDIGVHDLTLNFEYGDPYKVSRRGKNLQLIPQPIIKSSTFFAKGVKVVSSNAVDFIVNKNSNCAICSFNIKLKSNSNDGPGVFTVSDGGGTIFNGPIEHPDSFAGVKYTLTKLNSTKLVFNYVSQSGCITKGENKVGCGKTLIMNSTGNFCVNNDICFSTQYIYYDSADEIVSYKSKWVLNDRKRDSNQLFCFKPDSAGEYNLRVYTKDSKGCEDSAERKFEISGVLADIVNIPEYFLCNELFQFFDSSIVLGKRDAIYKYSWNFGDNTAKGSVKDPTHYYAKTGKYKLELNVTTYAGCSGSVQKEFTILGPDAKCNITSDTIGCAPLKINFTNLSSYASFYQWYFNDSNYNILTTEKKEDTSFIYDKSGIYFPVIYAVDTVLHPITKIKKVCRVQYPAEGQQPLRVVVKPNFKMELDGPKTLCLGEEGKFRIKTNGLPKKATIFWGDGDKLELNSVAGNINKEYSTSGIFKIELIADSSNNYCKKDSAITIEVEGIEADFLQQPAPLPAYNFINQSSVNSVKYEWKLKKEPDQKMVLNSNKKDEYYEFPAEDAEYSMCLIAENKLGCKDSICKEIETIKINDEIRIANVFTPNKSDNLNTEFDIIIVGEKSYNLQITNRWGEVVFKQNKDAENGTGGNWNGKFNNAGADCPEGTYFYEFTYEMKALPGQRKTVRGPLMLIRGN